MIFRSHRQSRTVHSATHEVHGETVVAFVHCPVSGSGAVPNKHVGRLKAEDVMRDLHVGGSRIKAGAAIEPVEFADHELVACPYSDDWLCSVSVGGEGIALRVRADNRDHARVKLGTMIRHLHDGDTHANAVARVAAAAAKEAALAAAAPPPAP
jgi:hypothetical protein